MDIQIKPIVTEKATAYSEKQNCYTFAVSPDANKFQIKDGLIRGQRAAFKKAYVTVAEGQKIDYYSNI